MKWCKMCDYEASCLLGLKTTYHLAKTSEANILRSINRLVFEFQSGRFFSYFSFTTIADRYFSHLGNPRTFDFELTSFFFQSQRFISNVIVFFATHNVLVPTRVISRGLPWVRSVPGAPLFFCGCLNVLFPTFARHLISNLCNS